MAQYVIAQNIKVELSLGVTKCHAIKLYLLLN
jgi:hypothetical protein